MALSCIKEQQEILDAEEQSILVTARPGRGKTTVALLLSERVIGGQEIAPWQNVLLLTFSRTAVYQIQQASGQILDAGIRRQLCIATYHSFMWWLLSVFGRFHGLPCRLDVMRDTKARAARMAAIQSAISEADMPRFLARDLAAISYSEFAPLSLDLLRGSENVRCMLRQRFPIVIVDEFQDTNAEQWELIKTISQGSRLVCFADPDQMIFRWRGASGERLNQLCTERQAKSYSLENKCLRTGESEILAFAEAILDDKPGSIGERAKRRKRFLVAYPGHNALGYYLKGVIRSFYSDYRRRGSQRPLPSIAVAAYSNESARVIQDALTSPDPSAQNVYRCALLEGESDDALDELIAHLAAWAAGGERWELVQAVRLAGGMLVTDISNASGPLAPLFAPEKLLSNRSQLKGTAKHVVELFEPIQASAATGHESIDLAVEAVSRLRDCAKSIGRRISEDDLEACRSKMLRIVESQSTQSALSAMQALRAQLSAERLRTDVLERVIPTRGIISSTLHKLKGREFDYVCVVTRSGDTLRSKAEEESDARRLVYVALTRARYDARILYVKSKPCLLLDPYLTTSGYA